MVDFRKHLRKPFIKRDTVEITIPQLLQKLGYRKGEVIKLWYVGSDYQHGIDPDDSEPRLEITYERKSKR